MHVSYHPRVRGEVNHAISWYEQRQSGLGFRFLDAFEAAIRDILEDPGRVSLAHGDDRQASVKGFPYGVVFRIMGDGIRITCLRHHSRHPRFGFGRK